MNDMVRDDGSLCTPLWLLSVREGKCAKCEQEGEGVEYHTGDPPTELLCSECILTELHYRRLRDPRDLLCVRATKTVIAWLEKVEGSNVFGRIFKLINEDEEEQPPEDLPTR